MRLIKLEATRNYLLDEIKNNDLKSKKCKVFLSVLRVLAVGINISAIITGIKSSQKYKSIKENEEKPS